MKSNHQLSLYGGWLPDPISHLLTCARARENVRQKEAAA
jgi:hypothetical protein